jgi:hydrogenase-4 component C
MDAGLLLVNLLQAALIVLLAPLFSGFSRVFRAKMHNRRGPGLLQNYHDLAKLFRRQEVVPEAAGPVFLAMPYVAMTTMAVIALIIPVLTWQSPLSAAGDMIAVIYLLALLRFLFAVSGLDSGSTFGGFGAAREMTLAALTEPAMLLVLFVMALLAGSTNLATISARIATGQVPFYAAVWLGMVAFAFAAFVEMGKLPFDLAEAEQELQEGPLSEYSGRGLALLKWSLYIKQLLMVALFVSIFLPFGTMGSAGIAAFLVALFAFLLKAVVCYTLAGLVENSMARTRFVRAADITWAAFGTAVLSFVFFLVRV